MKIKTDLQVTGTVTADEPTIAAHVATKNYVDSNTPASGLPIGGTTGQVLGKISPTNYDVNWIDAVTGGGQTIKSYDYVAITNGTASYHEFTAALSTVPGTALTLAAEVGDWIEVDLSVSISAGTAAYVVLGLVIDAATDRYLPQDPFTEGVSGWWNGVISTGGGLEPSSGAYVFQVQSDDLVNGTVTFSLCGKLGGTGSRYIRARPENPLIMWARNWGPEFGVATLGAGSGDSDQIILATQVFN